MQASTSSSTSSPAPLIGIVAGIVIAIGAFLPWAKETALGNSQTAAGFDGWEGKVCLIAGAGIAIGSFVAMRQGRVRQIAAVLLIGGIIATGVAAYTAVTAKDQFHDALVSELVSQGIVPDEATADTAVQAAIDGGQVTVSISFGLYVVIFGGVAAIAAVPWHSPQGRCRRHRPGFPPVRRIRRTGSALLQGVRLAAAASPPPRRAGTRRDVAASGRRRRRRAHRARCRSAVGRARAGHAWAARDRRDPARRGVRRRAGRRRPPARVPAARDGRARADGDGLGVGGRPRGGARSAAAARRPVRASSRQHGARSRSPAAGLREPEPDGAGAGRRARTRDLAVGRGRRHEPRERPPRCCG